MISHDLAPISLLVVSTLTAAFFAYLYVTKQQRYLFAWTLGWSLLAVHYVPAVLEPLLGPSNWLSIASHFLMGATAIAFFCAARLYANARPLTRWAIAGALVFAVWAVAAQFGKFGIRTGYGTTAVLLAVAWVFWQESRRQETVVDRLLAIVFFLWAPLILLLMHFQAPHAGALQNAAAVGSAPQLCAAVLMVMAIHEEERRRVERNILALTNLNLSTSSFVGSEIKETLSQALDRVLSVVRLPVGAIFLQHGDAHGPSAAVSAGLDGSFCRAAEENHLQALLIGLVARLGGLKVFRDFDRDPQWIGTSQEEGFASFRQLAVTHHLRTVVGISLQAKEQPFGVLLLATPENRQFTQAELRLLLALGHQIAMAVENSYLIQQSSRRSEELNVLNEIGRTLNSTLDPDTLFDKIFSALQSMFDVNNFAIVLYDSARNQVSYELDIVDGIRLPKYSRTAGNGLPEYVLRTGQPLLFRKNLAAEAAELGIEPLRTAKSFCGVPLMAYDRAIGAMLVYSHQEGMYDKEHLDMMQVLASEACIAIENARLFRGELAKSRHLTLLNNISRHAISTLNPDEMLANVAEQLESGLTFDHIGVGLLDYANKEIIVQAESGRRRGALGRRIALGSNLVGSVARTGQTAIVRDVDGSPEHRPMLDDSSSAIALPLFYADQLHGVLYIETSEKTDFPDEDILLLQTLSDLISGALHNALSFQKAQAQAITDGLTGIKTHRFFMEALSAEWKRSTRAGRTFSVVLMDLDRFKAVNDIHGHLEGDLVLTRIAQLLEQSCRRSDVVARYGGDEFVILMPETNIEQGYQFAQKLCAGIFGDSMLHEKNITASLGVASFPAQGSTPQELIQIADASMYLSKHQGGNSVSSASNFDPGETKKWKQDVLEAYLGITLKRLFCTGPEAFQEIRNRLEQFSQSLGENESESVPASPRQNTGYSHGGNGNGAGHLLPAIPAAVVETVSSLALAIDGKDHYTKGHSPKVAGYAVLIAERLGLNEKEVEHIHLGGLLHDIGKVGIQASILNKSGPLDPDEWEVMKEHVRLGDELLEPLIALTQIRDIVLHHHEMYDGSGYPEGLNGEGIPLGARIVAIADAYDTITSERIYKKAQPSGAALAELERCAGAQFDPQLVRLFIEAVQELPQPIIEPVATSTRSQAS